MTSAAAELEASSRHTAEVLERVQVASFKGARTAAAAWPPTDRLDADDLTALLVHRRHGLAATTRPDGRPHVAPTGFVGHGGLLWLPTVPGAVRLRNTARTPSLVFAIEDDDPHAYLGIEGRVGTQPIADGPVEVYAAKYRQGAEWAGVWFAVTPLRVLSYRAAGWRRPAGAT